MNWTYLGMGMTSATTKAIADTAIFGHQMNELKVDMFIEQNDMNGLWTTYLPLTDKYVNLISKILTKI